MNAPMKSFGALIDRMIAGQHLTREETRAAFLEILDDAQPEIHQGAFLSAITANGPTPEEIAGAWQAVFETDTVKAKPETPSPVVDNCGTGMDGFKTFNISTAAAIVAAAGGVSMARHGARAITSNCGTVDLCEALGVDVDCDADQVKNSIERTGIGIFNGMSPQIHPNALFRILSRMCFGSILNIAASLANPASPDLAVRGVYHADMVMPVARTLKAIGFRRALIFHGASENGGMDELSPCGDNRIAELQEDGEIRQDTVSAASLGIRTGIDLRDIAGGDDPRTEALRLLNVFGGKDKNGLYDTICLNAAPIFYIAGSADTLRQGVEKAKDIIDGGDALNTLKSWVSTQNNNNETGEAKLADLLSETLAQRN